MGRFFKFKLTVLSLFFGLGVFANTITVEPNNPQKTIKKAFEKAKDGDTILIKSGIYREGPLYLDKSVTLTGEGFPVIDGEFEHEILKVESDGVTIRGILFKNSGTSNFNDIAALKIQNSKNVLIDGCKFEDNFFGIHTINSSYITYTNNDIKSRKMDGRPSANGIHCWKSNHLTIKNNQIHGHRDGIYFEFITNSDIENNESMGNSRYGLHFMFSHDNLFKNNTFQNNGAGVAVMYSKRVKMYNNHFKYNWGLAAYGLLLKEIDDSEIYDNEFSENTIGIFADGANRIKVTNNQFYRNGWAFKINASSTDALITANNFIGNTFDMATNGNLKVKSLDHNYWDKYEGYDLDRDGIGDIPYHPITFYSLIIERNSSALMLFRSFFVKLMDTAESIFPSLTPENVKDNAPMTRKIKKQIT
ncbi:MAG: nitrous oxide reductase family maturation protein NosD [Moheibacter sp.]